MPKYRVLARTLLGPKVHEEHAIIEYNNEYGIAGSTLQLIEEDAPEVEAPSKIKVVTKSKKASDAD